MKVWILGYNNDNTKVITDGFKRYATYEEAENEAKRIVRSPGTQPMMIFEAVAVVSTPIPAAEVTKL